MPRLLALLLAFALTLALPARAQEEDNVVGLTANDPAMSAAIETARSHLGQVFAATISEFGLGHPALSLKVAFPVEGGETEVEAIWVGEISLAQQGMAGKLQNEPLNMPGLHAGDEVRFDEAMIYDWSLAGPEGKFFGHFTTRILLGELPDAQAEALRAVLTEDPLPDGWR